MRIAYFDCFSGISGDMTVGAFLDAGLPMKALEAGLKKLRLGGYELRSSKVLRGPIAGTKFDCIARRQAGHGHRSIRDIESLIDRSALSSGVKGTAKRIVETLGRAEARVHGRAQGRDVRLHEAGEIDSIVDIVGTAIAVDELGIDEVRASVVTMGRSSARTAHGIIPIPGPAALEALKGVPVAITETDAELVTPTGACILKALAKSFGPMPAMEVAEVGYGAGARSLDGMPNLLRIVIGEAAPAFANGRAVVVETNIDDMNPQYFEYVAERLFAEGALDVYTTPIQMKKSRPGITLSVICDPGRIDAIAAIIFRETTTIGVRYYEVGRRTLERTTEKARTKFGDVRVKVSSGPGGVRTVSPEYDDCVRLARAARAPLKTVYEAARLAAQKR